MFCFLAFFSCEQEDAFPETYGPVEPLVKHVSLATDAYADMALLSAILEDQYEDPSAITEGEVIQIRANRSFLFGSCCQKYNFDAFALIKDSFFRLLLYSIITFLALFSWRITNGNYLYPVLASLLIGAVAVVSVKLLTRYFGKG